jgi:hypothetical protein
MSYDWEVITLIAIAIAIIIYLMFLRMDKLENIRDWIRKRKYKKNRNG